MKLHILEKCLNDSELECADCVSLFHRNSPLLLKITFYCVNISILLDLKVESVECSKRAAKQPTWSKVIVFSSFTFNFIGYLFLLYSFHEANIFYSVFCCFYPSHHSNSTQHKICFCSIHFCSHSFAYFSINATTTNNKVFFLVVLTVECYFTMLWRREDEL